MDRFAPLPGARRPGEWPRLRQFAESGDGRRSLGAILSTSAMLAIDNTTTRDRAMIGSRHIACRPPGRSSAELETVSLALQNCAVLLTRPDRASWRRP